LADLDHIRALLVAQTAEAEPKSRSLLGRLFARRTEAPPPRAPVRYAAILDLATPLEPASRPDSKPEPEPEHTLRPGLVLEEASRLRPPDPRSGFGRRPEAVPPFAGSQMAREPELVLDQPAAGPRRLQLLDASGQPVGEMILQPNTPREEVPYFPEDFLDHGDAGHDEPPLYERLTHEPQLLRPWLKSLRPPASTQPAAEPVSAPELDIAELDIAALDIAKLDAGAPLASQVRQRRTRASRPRPSKPVQARPAVTRPLGEDLLGALALALAREHETLADRLLALAASGTFGGRMEAGESAAA